MGFLAKSGTNRATADQTVMIGGWLAEVGAAFPMLQRGDLLTLATIRTLMGADLSKIVTSCHAGVGRRTDMQLQALLRPALARATGGANGATQIQLGTTSPRQGGTYHNDWAIHSSLTDDGTVTLSVPQYRTLAGKLENGPCLEQVRRALSVTLSTGGVQLTLTDAPPSFDGLVAHEPLPKDKWGQPQGTEPSKSPFNNDYLLPIPDVFHDGATIALPVDSRDVVLKLMGEDHYPAAAHGDDILVALALDGGRNGCTARLSLLDAATGPVLRLDLPEEGAAAAMWRHRTFRATLIALSRIARLAGPTNPEASDAIQVFVAACHVGADDPQRSSKLVPTWSETVPLEVVRVDARLPIGLVVRSGGPSCLTHLADAQSWLVQRERSSSSGLTQKSRDANRTYFVRYPAFLQDSDGKLTNVVRYCDAAPGGYDSLWSTSGKSVWFWQTTMRSTETDSGWEATLLVNGLSQAQGILGYGVELLSFLRAFTRQVLAHDPHAEISTIYLD